MNFEATGENYAFESYHDARASFLEGAKTTGGLQASYVHPNSPSADGTQYAIDTVWYGPRDASCVLVMISGTHGLELFSGSAMQRLWMDKFRHTLAPDTGVLLIHAVNAYGSAHYSRTTENNVDLNRNFVDFAAQSEHSKLTERVQNALCKSDHKGPRQAMVTANLLWLAISQGKGRVINEITSGQYQRRDGIGFGGFAPEWSNQTLHKIVADNLSDAKRVAVIDWHTGIGSYGDPFFLCFDDPVSPEFARARAWWGSAVGDDASGYDGDERPDYQGLLIKSIRDQVQLLGASTTAAVIEFGTFSNQKMLQALLIDRWLRCEAALQSAAIRDAHIKEVRHRFCPDDPKWRESVVRQGYSILNQTMQGMANWGQCDE